MPFKNLAPFPKLGCGSLGSYRPRNRATASGRALEIVVVLQADMAFLLSPDGTIKIFIHLWLNVILRVLKLLFSFQMPSNSV